jgi:hypothetical protein
MRVKLTATNRAALSLDLNLRGQDEHFALSGIEGLVVPAQAGPQAIFFSMG